MSLTLRRTASLAFRLFFASASALAPACAAPTDATNEASDERAAASAAEGLTVPAWNAIWDYQGVDLDSFTATQRNAGYRPISISAWGSTSAPRFAAVYVQRPGPAFHVLHNVGNAAWQNTFNSEAAAGYKPALLSFDGDPSNPIWAAVFVATTTGIPYTRNGLGSGSKNDNTKIEYWLELAHQNNLIPSTLSIYGTAANPAYAVVLEPNSANVQWSVGQSGWPANLSYAVNDTHADYQARWDAQVPAGNQPRIVELNQDERYISLYRDDSVGPLLGRHGYQRADVDALVAQQKANGLFPISIQGGGNGANARFALFFAQSDLPLPRQTTAVGSAAPGDTSISAIDDAVTQFMKAHDVRQASLAVMNGKKLAYARGYGYQEATNAQTNATTTFRLASVSKIVTAMEIMHLVDRGQLKLTDKAQDILQLKTNTGASPPALFGTITVQNLLQHNFPTLMQGATTKCLKRDVDVSQGAADALGVSLPVSRAGAISLALGASDLLNRDWSSNEGCYSNFGYMLLGQIIEKKRGMSYLSAVGADMFAPLSITHAHVASGIPSAQPANEAVYRSIDLLTTSSVDVAGGPLATLPYGGANYDVGEAAGGLSMAAPDVARLLTALGIGAGNPIYNNSVSMIGVTSTPDQILQNRYGFDQSPRDAYGVTHYVKGGEIDGTQTTASFVKNGVGYVLLWAHDGLDNLGTADNWWPTWGTLETAIHNASLDARPDLFPSYGMPSL